MTSAEVARLVGGEELADGERVGLGQWEQRGLERQSVVRGVIARRLIAGVHG